MSWDANKSLKWQGVRLPYTPVVVLYYKLVLLCNLRNDTFTVWLKPPGHTDSAVLRYRDGRGHPRKHYKHSYCEVSFNLVSWTIKVSSVVDKLRRGVAKTIQAASEGEVFDKLSDCEALSSSNKISIRLIAFNRYVATSSCEPPIRFEIKAKDQINSNMLFYCEVVPSQGIVVRTPPGNIVMDIRLPDNSQTSMGKILHPAGSTLFKIDHSKKHPHGEEYSIKKLGLPMITFIHVPVSEIFGPLKSILRIFNCINGDHTLDFYKLNNLQIGCMRPSYFSGSQSVVLDFSDPTVSVEERAVMLGTCLLFFVAVIRPDIAQILRN